MQRFKTAKYQLKLPRWSRKWWIQPLWSHRRWWSNVKTFCADRKSLELLTKVAGTSSQHCTNKYCTSLVGSSLPSASAARTLWPPLGGNKLHMCQHLLIVFPIHVRFTLPQVTAMQLCWTPRKCVKSRLPFRVELLTNLGLHFPSE